MEKQVLLEERRLHNLIFRKMQRMGGGEDGRRFRLQGMIIAFLCEHPDGRICQKDLEAEFFVRGSTMAAALGQLEAAGYIVRSAPESDRRVKMVAATCKAKEAYAGMNARLKEAEKMLVQGITAEELAVYFGVVDKICNNLEADNK